MTRGVQEPLNETMCGCNDINAPPGQMGEHGSEGDGGCECAGLTMRGRHLLILDTVANANRIRRTVNRELQFPATIALGSGDQAPSIASYSMVAKALPANVGLMTLTNNYASIHDGKLLLRFAHLYSVGEDEEYSKPVTFRLTDYFPNIVAAEEMSVTGNQLLKTMDSKKYPWKTHGEAVDSTKCFEQRVYMDGDLSITLRPMEVRTLFVQFK